MFNKLYYNDIEIKDYSKDIEEYKKKIKNNFEMKYRNIILMGLYILYYKYILIFISSFLFFLFIFIFYKLFIFIPILVIIYLIISCLLIEIDEKNINKISKKIKYYKELDKYYTDDELKDKKINADFNRKINDIIYNIKVKDKKINKKVEDYLKDIKKYV